MPRSWFILVRLSDRRADVFIHPPFDLSFAREKKKRENGFRKYARRVRLPPMGLSAEQITSNRRPWPPLWKQACINFTFSKLTISEVTTGDEKINTVGFFFPPSWGYFYSRALIPFVICICCIINYRNRNEAVVTTSQGTNTVQTNSRRSKMYLRNTIRKDRI